MHGVHAVANLVDDLFGVHTSSFTFHIVLPLLFKTFIAITNLDEPTWMSATWVGVCTVDGLTQIHPEVQALVFGLVWFRTEHHQRAWPQLHWGMIFLRGTLATPKGLAEVALAEQVVLVIGCLVHVRRDHSFRGRSPPRHFVP